MGVNDPSSVELESDRVKQIDSERLADKSEEALQIDNNEALDSPSTEKPNLLKSDRLQLDSIRAELVEKEQYYSGETDYWDNTHNWSDDGDELVSNDYWHFLGFYE